MDSWLEPLHLPSYVPEGEAPFLFESAYLEVHLTLRVLSYVH